MSKENDPDQSDFRVGTITHMADCSFYDETSVQVDFGNGIEDLKISGDEARKVEVGNLVELKPLAGGGYNVVRRM